MNEFEYKSLLEQRRMTLEELEEYFRLLRKVEFERQTLYDMKIRKKILVLIKLLLMIDRIMNHRKIKVIGDERYRTDSGKVYVCTSSSNFALPSLVERLDELTWTVLSSLSGHDAKTVNFLRRMNLVTFLDDQDSAEKKVIENRMYRNLAAGGSELVFPEIEETRNGNFEVGTLDNHFVKRVVDASASIIPVAILDSDGGNKTLIKFGKNLEIGHVSQEYHSEVARIVQNDLTVLKGELIDYSSKKLTKVR